MVEPLVVSPSGVDAIALGDSAAFEHNGVLVQHDGIGTGEFGRSLAFVRDPRFVGTGFFAGEAPDGLTTVYGDPISADVFVYWRDPDDPMAQEVLVGATKSAPDGTWCITGLNYNLQYVIRARASGRDDVTVVGVQPSRTDVITYEGEFTNTEDFDGAAGEILITSGLPPFTATVIQPLPYGLLPVIDGRKLIVDGTSDDEGVWNSVVRVTASNGVWVDIPISVYILGVKTWTELLHNTGHAPVFAYDFDGNYLDSSGFGRNASATGLGNSFAATDPRKGQSLVLNGSGGAIAPRNAVLGNADRTVVVVCRPLAASFASGSTIAYMGGGDGGSSGMFYAFGIGFVGSAASPRIRLDYNRNIDDFVIPEDWVGSWLIIVVTHTAGSQKVYVTPQGGEMTLIGAAYRNLNTKFSGSGQNNYIGLWNGGRRMQGELAFLGMIPATLTEAEVEAFRFPNI